MNLPRRDFCLGALAALGCSTMRRGSAPAITQEDARAANTAATPPTPSSAAHAPSTTAHAPSPAPAVAAAADDPPIGSRLVLTDDEWRRRLRPDRFEILRRQGTEPSFSDNYWNNHVAGTYRCAGCNAPLFTSADKFESGTGWPSFTRPIAEGRVARQVDTSHGMERDEVHCARCDGHLGHVFEDGPPPTGLRYCIDGLALEFRPA